ncbi:MAG: VRR-NUC domain-containing protein [Bacteroidota bacterium]|nr:VRR-NUC domain-containing protein [Bacteroidota bacterium]
MASTTITNALTQQCIRMLHLAGVEAWRQNNGGVYDPKIKRFRKNSSTPGISDVIGFHRATGRFVACEVKVGKDKLSEEQLAFLRRVKAGNGITMVVRTVDDAAAIPDFIKKCLEERRT